MDSKRNGFLDVIRSRRSIRRYLNGIPSDEQIESVLEAGRWAPSGLNNQPWRFVVVKYKAIKDKLAGFTKYSEVIKGAPIAICVFMDISSSYNRDKDILAIGACIQNMLLGAHSQGLATCWLGEILNKKEDVRSLLELDSNYELMAVISLGFSDEKVNKGSREPLKNLVLKRFNRAKSK